MTDEPTDPSTLLDATFAASLAGEPPLAFDLAAVQRYGARRQQRRRTWAMGSVAAAVVSVTAGIAIAVPRLDASVGSAGPAAVPGCQTVLRTTDPVYLSWQNGFLGGTAPAQGTTTASPATAAATSAASSAPSLPASPGTSDDQHPAWFTPGKASNMAKALRAALPAGAQLRPATTDGTTPDPLPFTAAGGTFGSASLQLGQNQGLLQLGVQPGKRGSIPPCIESTTLRYTAPDGTVADIISGTAPETGPGGGPYLVADAVHPDGTWVHAYLSIPEPVDASARLPITATQLARIVAAPGLSITQ